MVFPGYFHGIPDSHLLLGVAEKIADHTDVIGIWQFNQHDEIRPALPERGMHGMPDALESVDFAAS